MAKRKREIQLKFRVTPQEREMIEAKMGQLGNLNQLTKRAHETGRVYDADLEDIRQNQERLWTAAEKIVAELAALR